MAKDTHRGSERPSRDRLELDTPVVDRRKKFIDFDGDRVGEVAENVARFLGTGKYLAFQTIIVIVWIAPNIGGMWWNWGRTVHPVNLAFSRLRTPRC